MTDSPQNKGERTRQALEDAAYRLFLAQGYHATSMRQIAEAAGLALGGIYNHFASKEEIFQAVIIAKHPYAQIIPLIASAPGDTTEAFIRNAAHAMVAELGHQPDFVKLMFIEIVEFNGRHFPALFQTIFPKTQPLLERFLSPASKIRPIPLPLLLRAFMGMFFSFYMTEFLMSDLTPPEMRQNALDGFVDIFLHGILQEPGSSDSHDTFA
jgi:AcrR family transcriptional regulator